MFFETTIYRSLSEYLVLALLGSFAAFLAHLEIAVFNDGLRPFLSEYRHRRFSRRSLITESLALNLSLIIGFGLPFSLTSPLILIHTIFLGTDVLGSLFPKNRVHFKVLLVFSGGLYAVFLKIGFQSIVDLSTFLPVNFFPALSSLGDPLVVAFAAFPAVVVASEYGLFRGFLVFCLTVVVRQLALMWGVFILPSGHSIQMSADGVALFTGIIAMLFFALMESKNQEMPHTQLMGLFEKNIQRLKVNSIPLALMGGLTAMSSSMGLLAGDPLSLNLLSKSEHMEAGLASLVRAIGFIPLVGTTAITTGIYTPAGMTFVFGLGIFIKNPILAFIAGFVCVILELLFIRKVAKFLDYFPGVKNCGDRIRESINRVFEIALLVGVMMAAHQLAPRLGFLLIAGFYSLNRFLKKPLVDIAVGPVSLILCGILLNVLYFLGLFHFA